MPTRSRRAAAAAAAAANHDDIFQLPEHIEASEDEKMLARLEAYRVDLAVQFKEHLLRLERHIKKDTESATAYSRGLSRLSMKQRRMPFLDYLTQELGLAASVIGCSALAAATEVGTVEEADENDPISERVKRSMKRKKSGSSKDSHSSGSSVKATGTKRARAKAAAEPGLGTVAEDEAVTAPASAARSVPGLASSTRQTRARAAVTNTPLSAVRGANSANRGAAPATRSRGGRGQAVAASGNEAMQQSARGLGRPLKEGETAFSSVGSPLINPFLLRPQDMRHLKRGDVSQLRKMMARLEDLLHRA